MRVFALSIASLLSFALFGLLLPDETPAQQKKKKRPFKLPENVELLRDVEYGKGGGRALRMHILRPKQQAKAAMPVLVWIHGGGWRAGNKNGGIPRLAPFAARGYFCASVEYRLSQEAKFPAQIEDCKCAIRYLRAHAKKYHLNANKIGVWGASAGGHLVALLGTSGDVKKLEGNGGWPDQSSRVNAVCDFCGPSELFVLARNSKGAKNPVAQLLGGPVSEKKELAKEASPVTYVSKDDPPFLIVHGDKDRLVPQNQAELLNKTLQKAGVESTLYIAEGRGHGLAGRDINQRVRAFFDRHLKGRKKRE